MTVVSNVDWAAARARVHELSDRCEAPWPKMLFVAVEGALAIANMRWKNGAVMVHFDLVNAPLMAAKIAPLIAQACFGDGSLVYDVTDRLLAGRLGYFSVSDLLVGGAPGYRPPPGLSLSHFVESKRHGIVTLDDAQMFGPTALQIIASMAESGLATSERSGFCDVPAQDFIFLVLARVAMPSAMELAKRAELVPSDLASQTPPRSFGQALNDFAREQYPEHFDSWARVRLGNASGLCAWPRFRELVERNELDDPLWTTPMDALHTLSNPVPALDPRDQVVDVDKVGEISPSPDEFDVFISYSWGLHADDATWLRSRLVAHGLRVFFDKDQIELSRVPETQMKEYLIRKLRWAVRSSRSRIVFAISHYEYRPIPGMSEDEAIRRGLAMRIPSGYLVEWCWQVLELRESVRHLVIEDGNVYLATENHEDRDFGHHKVQNREELESLVMKFLACVGVLPGHGTETFPGMDG